MNQKWLKSDFYGLKGILNTKIENFQNVLVRVTWNFVCKSEIVFWCNVDQKISKAFQYFKVWIKSSLKVTFTAQKWF